MYISQNKDIDQYLIFKYFEIDSLIAISQLNKSLNLLAKKTTVYQQFLSFTVQKHKSTNIQNNIYVYACSQGNLELIISLNTCGYAITLIIDAVSAAVKNNQLVVLDFLSAYIHRQDKKIADNILKKYIYNGYNDVKIASASGRVDILKWIKNHDKFNKILIKSEDNTNLYQIASANGHVNILDWLNNNNYQFNSRIKLFINSASENGHPNILDWFKNSTYIIYCDSCYVYNACKNGHVNILDWFLINYSIMFHNISHYIITACKNNHVSILNWFVVHYRTHFDIIKAIYTASKNGHCQILDWLSAYATKNNIKFKYDHQTINIAASNGHCQVLDWFKNSNYEFLYTDEAIDLASKKGYCHILKWFQKFNYKFKHTNYIVCDNSEQQSERIGYAVICKCVDRTKYSNYLNEQNYTFKYDHRLTSNLGIIRIKIFHK